jgi:zinc protease
METQTSLEQLRLDNGLTVILAPWRQAPVVAMQAWVGVGSADEPPSRAGIAHVFEHMLFKGTRRRGIGAIAHEIEAAGGEINAFTSFHHTVFHLVLASRYFDIGLDVLADALQNSTFDRHELEREREVVIEEILQSRDNPMRNVAQTLLSTAFTRHPYGRPVIGSESTVRALERSHLLQFFRRWYVANNITLVVAGEFDETRARRAITSALGSMPSRALSRRPHREPAQTAPRARVITRDVRESYMALGFPIPAASSPALPALDVAAIVLGQGESSRLVSRLRRERELVTAVQSHAQPLLESGLFVVSAAVHPDQLLDAVEAAAAETFGLAAGDIGASEIDKAQRALEADIVYQRETIQNMARSYGYYHATTGNPEFEAEYLDRIRRLTPGDVGAAAAQYFAPERATITAVLPHTAGSSRPSSPAVAARRLMARVRSGARQATRAPRPRPVRAAGASAASAADVIHHVLPSGMRVLIKPDHSVPVVAMRAVWIGGLRLETPANNGITHLLSRMILRGCKGMSAETVIARVDDMAGSLAGVSGRNSFGLQAEWLAKNWEQGLELLAQCITAPDLPAMELSREKRRLMDELRARADSPSFAAFRLFSETLYRHHPYRMDVAGTPESVAAIDRATLASFYRRNFPVSELTLAIVGDVDPERAIAQVSRLFGHRPARKSPRRAVPQESFGGRPAGSREVYRFIEREQAHLIVGFPGVTLHDPDRFALEVLTTILGGQGGRLFVELRDRRALAYRVSAMSVEGVEPGYIAVYMACSPDKLPQALDGVRAELGALVADEVSPAELERAKRYLVGTHEISLQRRSSVALTLALHEASGLGYQEYARYSDAIRAVSAADVRRVAARYLDWDLAVTATVRPPHATPEAARRSRGVKKRAPGRSGVRARKRSSKSPGTR